MCVVCVCVTVFNIFLQLTIRKKRVLLTTLRDILDKKAVVTGGVPSLLPPRYGPSHTCLTHIGFSIRNFPLFGFFYADRRLSSNLLTSISFRFPLLLNSQFLRKKRSLLLYVYCTRTSMHTPGGFEPVGTRCTYCSTGGAYCI